MKNKLLIGSIIPSITAFGLIGSGFSLWVFNESNTAKIDNQNISIKFTQTIKSGNIELTGDTLLVLDQKQESLDNGCYFVSESNDNIEANYSYNFTKSSIDENGYIDGTTDILFTTTINVSSHLAKYVHFDHSLGKESVYKNVNENSFTHNEDYTSYTFTSLASNHKDFSENSNSNIFINTTLFDWDNMSVQYTSNYPTSLDTYLEMVNELNNNSEIEVIYSAKAFIK